jgi:hypothetical protein
MMNIAITYLDIFFGKRRGAVRLLGSYASLSDVNADLMASRDAVL